MIPQPEQPKSFSALHSLLNFDETRVKEAFLLLFVEMCGGRENFELFQRRYLVGEDGPRPGATWSIRGLARIYGDSATNIRYRLAKVRAAFKTVGVWKPEWDAIDADNHRKYARKFSPCATNHSAAAGQFIEG